MAPGRHPRPLQPRQIHAYQTQVLCCGVMQFTRDPTAFLFLCMEPSGTDLPQFFLRLSSLSVTSIAVPTNC